MMGLRVARWVAVVVLGMPLASQVESQKPRPVDPGQLHRDREAQQVREGKLIHVLIRHALGLPIDAQQHLELSEGEAGVSQSAARAQLLEARKVLARRAAELSAKQRSTPDTGPATQDPGRVSPAPMGEVGSRIKTDVREPAAYAPDQPRTVVTSRPVSPQPRPKVKPAIPGAVQAIITGSASRSAVGRILFKAGKFDAALRELAPLESDKSADLGDLFYLARTHEELHDVARRVSGVAGAAAVAAKARAAQAAAGAAKIRNAGRHLRSVGGTVESVAEYRRLMTLHREAVAAASKRDAEHQTQRRVAAKHYEKAYGVLILIEGRDLKQSPDGGDLPGRWAKAARSARNMMKWIETNEEWTPPVIRNTR